MAQAEHFKPSRRFRFLPDRNAFYRWWVGRAGSAHFQSWASRMPITRAMAKRDGEKLFDLVAGFVYSQVLSAFVQLDLAKHLSSEPLPVDKLAVRTGVGVPQMEVLCQAAAALGLMKRRRDGLYGLGRLGAALPGVPGLAQMIAHHDVLYRDLADPVQFFAAPSETELAKFWPYVFGVGGAGDPKVAEVYSKLMTDSQGLVAEETLRIVDLPINGSLMDVGGGTGAFLRAVHDARPQLDLTLFDLPAVVTSASLPDGAKILPGSFRTDALPDGARTITLIRVLYDHTDSTVRDLLAKAYAALPPGGRLIVSEPMTGGAQPTRPGDAYFGLYCMAMQTGKARSQAQIAALMTEAGFTEVRQPTGHRPFVTSVVTGMRAQVAEN